MLFEVSANVYLLIFFLHKPVISIIIYMYLLLFHYYVHWHNKFFVKVHIYIFFFVLPMVFYQIVFSAIPKDVVKINIYLDNGVTLKAFGRELSIRPAERAVKKFKNSSVITL